MEFKPWPKIKRIENRSTPVFTEKIDGTNACIVITEQKELFCQSRSRFITPDDDNYGFAKWVHLNRDELIEGLGEGHHFGEWWGLGIQRGYGQINKRFSLFNTRRWGEHNIPPMCCDIVPLIPANTPEEAKLFLLQNGSIAAPGWTKPEGAVMYEPDTDTCFKIIIDK